jgi:D-alanyl-lipoteichoic acid acyltransferase DltB (MBOAT superfamily)
MTYLSLKFYLFVFATLLIYYLLPLTKRWIALLIGNVSFYMFFYKTGWWIFLVTMIISYLVGLIIDKHSGRVKNMMLVLGIFSVVSPWFIIKNSNFILANILRKNTIAWVVPMGISFYTLQIVAYMIDVYKGEIDAEKNIAKYMLFVSYFPQIIQGPIPRYNQLRDQLVEGHLFDENKFVKGFCFCIWGFFLKLVIADKAGIIVNTVFDHYPTYSGLYIFIASILYSIQLYADFLACTTLSQGVSKLFGIEIIDNFARPYFATSIKDFWRRWHISLSSWLRDYVYIPLGGNRKGKMRKIINLIITFLVSGLWHGAGYKYIAWGLLHAAYQIIGDITLDLRESIYNKCNIAPNSNVKKIIKQIGTFWLVNLAWIIFRSNIKTGLRMIKHMVCDFNPWILFNDRLFTLGLGWKEVLVLVFAIWILWRVSRAHERGISISDKIMGMRLPLRWAIFMAAIIGIMVFGTYGFGFNAQDFIYGGF